MGSGASTTRRLDDESAGRDTSLPFGVTTPRTTTPRTVSAPAMGQGRIEEMGRNTDMGAAEPIDMYNSVNERYTEEEDVEHDEDGDEDEDEDNLSQADSEYQQELEEAAAKFASASMSLEMDNEDLLFNLMYFGDQNSQQTLGGSLDTALHEVLASHSEGNTPYKLRPVSDTIADRLKALSVKLSDDSVRDKDLISVESCGICTTETECPVCKDCMDSGEYVVLLPTCKHLFHRDCMLRWVTLQDWCPVCRSNVEEAIMGCDDGRGGEGERAPLGYKDDKECDGEEEEGCEASPNRRPI